jgi:hypothetical protein
MAFVGLGVGVGTAHSFASPPAASPKSVSSGPNPAAAVPRQKEVVKMDCERFAAVEGRRAFTLCHVRLPLDGSANKEGAGQDDSD